VARTRLGFSLNDVGDSPCAAREVTAWNDIVDTLCTGTCTGAASTTNGHRHKDMWNAAGTTQLLGDSSDRPRVVATDLVIDDGYKVIWGTSTPYIRGNGGDLEVLPTLNKTTKVYRGLSVFAAGGTDGLTITPGASSTTIAEANNLIIIDDTSAAVTLACGSTNGVKIGRTGESIGFFGQTPAWAQEVDSSATTGDIIAALKVLGLFVDP